MRNVTVGNVQGVQYALKKGQYYFSLEDAARKLGFKSVTAARDMCPNYDRSTKLPNGREAILFDDLIMLSKGSPNIPEDFIDALKEEISRHRNEADKRLGEGSPDFSNPAEAARAWAMLYEQSETLKTQLSDARKRLGDGTDFKIVRAIPWLEDYFAPLKYMPMVVGSFLAHLSKKEKKPIQRCQAFGYQKFSIGMYSVEIIQKLKDMLDGDENFMARWRKKKA